MMMVEMRLLASSASIGRVSRTAGYAGRVGHNGWHGATGYSGADAMKKSTLCRRFELNQRRSFLAVARKFWTPATRRGSAVRHRFVSSSGGPKQDQASHIQTFWQRFLGSKPMPERHTAAWFREMLLICTVFGITGSSTMIVRSPGEANGDFRSCLMLVSRLTDVYCSSSILETAGTSCRWGCPWNQRLHPRWPVDLSHMFTCYHDTHLRNAIGDSWNSVWAPCIFSSLFGQNL